MVCAEIFTEFFENYFGIYSLLIAVLSVICGVLYILGFGKFPRDREDEEFTKRLTKLLKRSTPEQREEFYKCMGPTLFGSEYADEEDEE